MFAPAVFTNKMIVVGVGMGRAGGVLPLGSARRDMPPPTPSHAGAPWLLVACSVKVLDEADRVAAPPGNMVVPFVAPDGDMVHPGQPGLPPGAAQFLPPLPQEFLQINGVGPLFCHR